MTSGREHFPEDNYFKVITYCPVLANEVSENLDLY